MEKDSDKREIEHRIMECLKELSNEIRFLKYKTTTWKCQKSEWHSDNLYFLPNFYFL